MANRFYDFDAAWEEHDARSEDSPEPIRVRLLGEEWELPGDMPAALVVRGARLAGGADRNLTLGEIIRFVSPMVPREILDRWLDEGMGERKLSWVLMRIIKIYMGLPLTDDEDGGESDEVGEAEAGTEPSSPESSPNGRSSKPTSPASTGSTSTTPSGQ